MKLGIVGLPNVGKSTLFNSLTKAGAESANYPFCTIDPNVGIVAVPDERLKRLGDMYQSKKVTPAVIEFVDIAGLVKGASKGEGLGNQFLANIREVDAIVHVVRCFEDGNVIHVDGKVDPARDIETINLELIFSDIEILERRIAKTKKGARMDKALAKGAYSRRALLMGRSSKYSWVRMMFQVSWLLIRRSPVCSRDLVSSIFVVPSGTSRFFSYQPHSILALVEFPSVLQEAGAGFVQFLSVYHPCQMYWLGSGFTLRLF